MLVDDHYRKYLKAHFTHPISMDLDGQSVTPLCAAAVDPEMYVPIN